MITEDEAAVAVATLSVLPYFPAEAIPRGVIINLLMRLCRNSVELEWLVNRTIDLWSKWEGPKELRAVYCAKFKPQDGVEARSSIFEDGIVPPEKPLPAFQPMALPPGAVVSADKLLDQAVVNAADEKDIRKLPEMSRWERKAAHRTNEILKDLETAPFDREQVPLEKPLAVPAVAEQYITADDIERAVAAKPDRREELIGKARETLSNPQSTWDKKEMAREILRGFGADI